MGAIDDLVASPRTEPHTPEHFPVFLRQRIPYRVGQINNGCTFFNHRLDHLDQIIDSRPCSVHGGEFHHIAELAGIGCHLACGGNYLRSALAQLMAQMNVGGGDEQMNPPPLCIPGCPHSSIDIPFDRAGEAADLYALNLAGDGLHRCKVTRTGYREARFHDIHAQLGQLAGQNDLLLRGKASPGACSPSRSVVSKI